jgi:hypothetical protein
LALQFPVTEVSERGRVIAQLKKRAGFVVRINKSGTVDPTQFFQYDKVIVNMFLIISLSLYNQVPL